MSKLSDTLKAKIEKRLKKYLPNTDIQEIDLNALWDSSLNIKENWLNIAEQLNIDLKKHNQKDSIEQTRLYNIEQINQQIHEEIENALNRNVNLNIFNNFNHCIGRDCFRLLS